MKFINIKRTPALGQTTPKDAKALGLLLVTTCALLVSIGALNGGTAPTGGVFDGIQTYLSGLMGSSFTLMLGLVSLVACVWQVAHGRGYGGVGAILGLLSLALVGPGLIVTAATSTRDPAAVMAQADSATLVKAPTVLVAAPAL